MRVSRIFLEDSLKAYYQNQTPLEIKGDRAHYVLNVLRVKQGQPLTVFDGRGGEYAGVVDSVTKRSATVSLQSFSPDDNTPERELSVGLCVIKKDAMDFAIQKLTELGASRIQPLISDRVSVAKKQYQGRLPHWRNVAISACEQSGMNQIPSIDAPIPLAEWAKNQQGVALCGIPGASQFKSDMLNETERVNILVGPEGGFSDSELELIELSRITGVDLGRRILRAETAAISLATLVMLGD